MSKSSLVTYSKMSPNYTRMAGKKNTHIVIHHMAGTASVQQCGAIFASASRQASAQYGIKGKEIGQYVDESNRAWTTSSYEIDSKAVTIEVSNSKAGGDWPISATSMKTLIALCVDICRRNKIKKLNYTGDKKGNLHMHCWYAATACPGPYLKSKFKYIADEVNKKLAAAEKTTTKTSTPKAIDSGKVIAKVGLNVRSGAGTSFKILKTLKCGTAVKCYAKKAGGGIMWWKISPTANQWVASTYVR